jgi:hypothetical protein
MEKYDRDLPYSDASARAFKKQKRAERIQVWTVLDTRTTAGYHLPKAVCMTQEK